jgi:uncharacterized membrane protein
LARLLCKVFRSVIDIQPASIKNAASHQEKSVMNSRLIASGALASVLAVGLAPLAHAADENAKEKCYGIAKPGSNDCANLSGSHSCAGQSRNANGPDEWNYVAKGTCAKIGGMSLEEAKAAMKK